MILCFNVLCAKGGGGVGVVECLLLNAELFSYYYFIQSWHKNFDNIFYFNLKTKLFFLYRLVNNTELRAEL